MAGLRQGQSWGLGSHMSDVHLTFAWTTVTQRHTWHQIPNGKHANSVVIAHPPHLRLTRWIARIVGHRSGEVA